MNRWENWDESKVRVRPNKKGSRPRTKESPTYSDAELGRVVTVDRGRYTVSLDDRAVSAVRAKALRRTPVVPGDIVGLVGDTSGEEGSLARLVRIEERSTLLRRSADDTDEAERVIVANADQLLIVVAAADPEPRTGFIDRALVAAYDAGIIPILLITKADLAENPADPAGLVSHYAELNLNTVVSSRASESRDLSASAVEELQELLGGRVTAMSGHSGVGKSTMVNALTGADRATGGVNAVTGRGRHTSSSAVALLLPEANGWIIDTPGIRSFGLAHVDPDDVLAAFEDLVEGSADCEPGCAHESPEGGCALDAWVGQGRAGEHGPARLKSLRGLLASLSGASEGPGEKRLGSVEP
ncbi:ribosome small subunit-dependent GTPase A [Nesterenkonia cremea]|uniref:Small ribosomal subunit biogenesis GTPase RsgA n=1 Tax=Nesterenkonia cremea TaxID=1882340 RepID=A0A917AM29_9MICC|nr:ribosome small subunit-dependent GTPase A [Nesterenkonia cremea]GGE61486.1 putative ribosome biogenesis GTPase RsgA [Nesterenkonia cremea]